MPGAVRPPRLARFENFELDVRAGELRRHGGIPVLLREQSLRILVLLLEHPGVVVQRDEIRKQLWPNDTIVEFEHSISAAINRLRQALGDSADKPKYVETLARRGYRWMVPVEWVEAQRDNVRPAEPEADSTRLTVGGGNLIGKKVSHYRVLAIIGGGGMGVVYKAEDLKLGRRVALKFLPQELASDAGALQRFEYEARSASALNHPNICTIYGVEEYDGQPFIVMELLEGQTLRDLVATMTPGNGTMELMKLLNLAVQITSGLEAAHRQGIIHRDIKPANIFVTSQGQAKILDFGLAKLLLQGTAAVDFQPADLSENSLRRESKDAAESLTASSPFLSRTGVAMGTAGYMSPEQVRGEKLDARTDLFSFALVLYEMATGQRAFKGDTGPVLQKAILNETPVPVRKLNLELPPKLEQIITKALKKDREARYQAASEVRVELESLKQEIAPRHYARWPAVAAAVVVGIIVSAAFWFAKRQPTFRDSVPDLKPRQLTTNSSENRVLGGAISSDGKYVAYSDQKGLHVKVIETGETRAVPQPEELNGKDVDWDIAVWFPDSARFLASAHPSGNDLSSQATRLLASAHPLPDLSSRGTSIWVASVSGEAPRKLRDEAIAYNISPDGSLISFGSNRGRFGDREIWLMGPDGTQARILYDTGEDSSLLMYYWSPDGQRVVYSKTDESGTTVMNRDIEGGPPTILFPPSEMEKIITDFTWLPDGRLIYPVREPGAIGDTCNYWAMRLDNRTGQTIEKPRQLTNWAGYCMGSTTVTSDGKRLVFMRWEQHITSYVADLVAEGTRILKPKHFPMSESSDAVADWALDSKSAILVSNRSGHYGIYKQSLDKDSAEPLVTQGFDRDAHMSPDSNSVIYFGTGENGPWPIRGPEPVMRVPITGGPPQRLFTASPGGLITCARSPSELCAIGEPTEDGKQLTVSAFDPLKGRGAELFRFDLGSTDGNWRLNVTPDGTRFAVLPSRVGPIYIYSLRGEILQMVRLKGRSHLQSSIWAADGKSLFVTADIRGGTVVLHVDLQGNAHVMWENAGISLETLAHPSPDGHHLEFDRWTMNGNMWMLENF